MITGPISVQPFVLFVTKDNKIVTPKSDSILPSITRRSLMVVAKDYLGLEVEQREVLFEEVPEFVNRRNWYSVAGFTPITASEPNIYGRRYSVAPEPYGGT